MYPAQRVGLEYAGRLDHIVPAGIGQNRIRSMKSKWSAKSARDAVRFYSKQGVGEDLALRVYTTRFARQRSPSRAPWRWQYVREDGDVRYGGRQGRCPCVKGSGWDMGDTSHPACRQA